MSDGSDPSGARVLVRNAGTGFVIETEVRKGSFLIQGLEVGGPYQLTIRRIGARPEQRRLGVLSLGEPLVVEVVLQPTPVVLDSLTSVAAPAFSAANSHGGTATTIADSVLHTLPSLNRDLYDFVRLVPQISTRVGLGSGGMSGGGVNFRLNQFLTNGVPQRSLAGNQPAEFAGGKSLPFEAVAEYQVLLAPFDVRYGDFAGAAVNTITRSGTNQLQGSLFGQYRGDALARGDTLPYQRSQVGVLLSGPLARDRAHFLIAAELQRLTAPMAGPYVGQPAVATAPVPVRSADLASLDTIMRSYGLNAGNGGAVRNRNPLTNLFGRVDAALPELNSRAVLWVSEADVDNLVFARGPRDTVFALSSQASTTIGRNHTGALQLHTALPRRGGGHNELFLSYNATRFGAAPEVEQPIVTVAVPRSSAPGIASVLTGTPIQAQGNDAWYRSVDLRNNFTLPLGSAHVVTLGAEAEWFRLEPSGLQNSYGTWNFLSLDSLRAGHAQNYQLARDLGGASVPLTGAQYAAYAGDRWLLGSRLSLTVGIRADLLDLNGQPAYNRTVDSIFGRRTDRVPSAHLHWSPRFGFTWNPDAAGRNQLRGGLGIFTGRPPLSWLHMPFMSYGFGTANVRCGQLSQSQGAVPAFNPDPLSPPVACAGASTNPPAGDVELVDPNLRMARTLRAVLAWDRRLPGDVVATAEALLTRNLSDFIFVNLNLKGPQGVDRHGRTLYGAFGPTGRSSPAAVDTTFPSVIELQNVSANNALQLSARLEKRFAGGVSFMAGYTWSRVRDVETPLRVMNRGFINWSLRALSGRHDDLSTGISLTDIPHRVTLAGTWRAPWSRWTTELAVLYVGESGSPFTYVTSGTGGRGDLNADGSTGNDPIYVPTNGPDPAEILFTGSAAEVAAQQQAFERFIEASPCLRRQRGHILERNSCREPWTNTTVVSLRQRVPLGKQGIEAQLDVFNLLNLLNARWGLRKQVESPGRSSLLEHVGQATGPAGAPEPVFRFAGGSPWTVLPAESAFQFQLGIAYRF